MNIAVLALQGAFIEHIRRLEALGATCREVRQLADWEHPFDAIVLPGGESTAQTKLMHELGLYGPIREAIGRGMPVLGTCAGLILLASALDGAATTTTYPRLATMDIRVRRNAYGRQLGSFRAVGEVRGVGLDVPMTFIRAPYIESVGSDVDVLATVDGRIVAARQGHQLVTAFHPELDDDQRLLRYFIQNVCRS